LYEQVPLLLHFLERLGGCENGVRICGILGRNGLALLVEGILFDINLQYVAWYWDVQCGRSLHCLCHSLIVFKLQELSQRFKVGCGAPLFRIAHRRLGM